MVDIYQLGLPHPSPEFLDRVRELVASTELDRGGKQWLDQQNNTTNSAEHLFFQNADIDQFMQIEFGDFFHQPIGGVVGIMKNTGPSPANHPPHIDRGRGLAINYYIQSGGSNVSTTFYDLVEAADSDASKNFTWTEIAHRRLGSVEFLSRAWYAYDVCRCHSIENIEALRYFVSIFVPDPAYTVDRLVKEYPNLILDRIHLHK